MRSTYWIAGTALLLSACGGGAGNSASGEAAGGIIKRQPGSWSQKIDLVRLEGKGVTPEAKAQMQGMFNMVGGLSLCVTPEAAAEEDMAGKLEELGARGQDCTFDRRNVSGGTIDIAGTCKGKDGVDVRLTAKGTNSATAQDMTMTIEPVADKSGEVQVMEMRVRATRNGDCKPGDITPPAKKAG